MRTPAMTPSDRLKLDAFDAMVEALRPFAASVGFHCQKSDMPILVGPHQYDLRGKLVLGDFRRARAALSLAERAKGGGK